MVLHRQSGHYNSDTSIYIAQLNPRCTEEEIIEELNLILRDDRLKKKKKEVNHFIVSAIVSARSLLTNL